MIRKYKLFFLFAFILSAFQAIAQTGNDEGDLPYYRKDKGFQIGITTGAYFANKYSAGTYDGYGFDIYNNFQPNDFTNSIMNQVINGLYGNVNNVPGQQDQIAAALGVQPGPGTWSFDVSDMPVNMKYTPAFLFGIATRYRMNKHNIIFFNLNTAKINVTGNFTIGVTPSTLTTPVPGVSNFQTFAITGQEQRLMLQLGYQRMLGKDDNFCFFVEGGWNMTYAKFNKSMIYINTLQIDLAPYYTGSVYGAGRPKILAGAGFGAFGGFGINMSGNKLCVQLVYQPSLETIKIGSDPKLSLQHILGLRAYGIL